MVPVYFCFESELSYIRSRKTVNIWVNCNMAQWHVVILVVKDEEGVTQ